MINFYNCDCMEFMAGCNKNSYHLSVVDPPYFSGPDKLGYYGKGYSSSIGIKRKEYKKIGKWDLPDNNYFESLEFISIDQIVWGANYFEWFGKPFKTPRRNEIEDFIKDNPKGWIVWDKCNGDSSFNDFEFAKASLDIDTVIFKYMWNGMMQGNGIAEGHIQQGNKKLNEKRYHPTQKPIFLYKWILREFAKKGYKILDTHGGSMTNAKACHDMGFDLDIMEIDKHYFDLGKKAYNNHIPQGRFF